MLLFLLRTLFGPAGRILPLGFWRAVARPVGALAWAVGVRRRVTLINLRLAWPELPEREIRRLGRRVYRRITTVLLELPRLGWMSREELERTVVIDNAELLDLARARGALLLSAHLGNWELLAVAAGVVSGVPFSVIVKPQRDGGVLDRMRSAHGNRTIPVARAAREASTILRAGGIVAMLADQSTAPPDPFIPLFGIPTSTFSTPARLALRHGVPVVIGYALWEGTTYRAVLELLPTGDLEDTPEGVMELTRRYVAHMENAVRRAPDQWLWTHRKWKHTPNVSYE